MRKFEYYECGEEGPITITEDEIISIYWIYWSGNMKRLNKDVRLITIDNCINDWCATNWAWETTDQ